MKLTMLPNKILRNISTDLVLPLNSKDAKLAKDMEKHIMSSLDEKNDLRPGVGIAANQVGFNKNMFFVHIPLEDGTYLTDFVVNPKLIAESQSRVALEHGEGCLSVSEEEKNTVGLVIRKWKIVVEAFSKFENKFKTYTLTGYPAVVFQHEMDHLNGKLFFDRINKKDPWAKDKNLIII